MAHRPDKEAADDSKGQADVGRFPRAGQTPHRSTGGRSLPCALNIACSIWSVVAFFFLTRAVIVVFGRQLLVLFFFCILLFVFLPLVELFIGQVQL
jgi:uncharacterized membrane protein